MRIGFTALEVTRDFKHFRLVHDNGKSFADDAGVIVSSRIRRVSFLHHLIGQ